METTIKEITFPIWKREEPILVSKEDIVGEVAKWAIRQAPTNESLSNPESEKTSIMVGPENLYQGLEKLHKRLGEIKPFKGLGFEKLTGEELENMLIDDCFEQIPEIMEWNTPEYWKESKPSDFIDLHALARNVYQSLLLEAEYHDD